MSRRPGAARALAVLAALLLAATAVSGCFGGGGGDDEVTPKTGTDPTPTPSLSDAPDPTDQIDPGDKKDKNESVPQAHQHHHWGTPAATEAFLFKGAVTLNNDDCQPDRFGQQRPGCVEPPAETHVGSVTFTPEDDADDVKTNAEFGIATGNKADAVLAGTNKITATFTWDDDNVGELLFFYRAANNPMLQPEEGIPVESGQTYTIEVKRGMADIAHQVALSKWAFRLLANGGPTADWAAPTKIGSGEVTVEIKIHNGGVTSIDPPHPNPWDTPILRLGGSKGDFMVIQAKLPVYSDGASDIPLQAPYIVPPGSAKLRVTAWVNATDANQAAAMATIGWGLAYHGANTEVYAKAGAPADGDAGAKVFEVPLTPIQWDSPYEDESFFEFAFYPMLGSAAEQGDFGYLDMQYVLLYEVERDPAYVFN